MALYDDTRDRQSFGTLAIASMRPGWTAPKLDISGNMSSFDPGCSLSNEGGLCLTIPSQGVGLVVVPFFLRLKSQMVSRSGILAAALTALSFETEERYVDIVRKDTIGNNLFEPVPTPLDYMTDYERGWEGSLEVAAVKGEQSLDNAGLHLEFDGRNITHEWQYMLVNYKVMEARI